jgi:hypothetical protein
VVEDTTQIRTGVLMKKKKWMGGWTERMFILTPTHLAYAYPRSEAGDHTASKTKWGHPTQKYSLQDCEVEVSIADGAACLHVRVHDDSTGAIEDMVLRPHQDLGKMPEINDDAHATESMSLEAKAAVRMSTAYGSDWTQEKECKAWHAAIQRCRLQKNPSTRGGKAVRNRSSLGAKSSSAKSPATKEKSSRSRARGGRAVDDAPA